MLETLKFGLLISAIVAASINLVIFWKFARLARKSGDVYRHLIAAQCRRSALRALSAGVVAYGLSLAVPEDCPATCHAILNLLSVVLLWSTIADWRTWRQSERIGISRVSGRGRRFDD